MRVEVTKDDQSQEDDLLTGHWQWGDWDRLVVVTLQTGKGYSRYRSPGKCWDEFIKDTPVKLPDGRYLVHPELLMSKTDYIDFQNVDEEESDDESIYWEIEGSVGREQWIARFYVWHGDSLRSIEGDMLTYSDSEITAVIIPNVSDMGRIALAGSGRPLPEDRFPEIEKEINAIWNGEVYQYDIYEDDTAHAIGCSYETHIIGCGGFLDFSEAEKEGEAEMAAILAGRKKIGPHKCEAEENHGKMEKVG